MTNAEKQEIIEAVLAALATNSKTIAQLSPKLSLNDSDMFEVAGGSRVTYLVLKNAIREGLALASQLSDYLTEENAAMYLAKLDTETGTIDFRESPCVMLDGFKDVNGYSPATGDLFYENRSGYQIWTKTQGGATGEHANTHVSYVNKNEGAFYRWTGTKMKRIGGCTVVNDLETGGEGDALSAEMGKELKQMIDAAGGGVSVSFSQGVTNIIIGGGGGGGGTVETTAAPTISVADSGLNKVVTITNDADETGATIYYTTDGSDPTANSQVYSSPITISASGTTTIKAIAKASGKLTSSVVAQSVYIEPNSWTDGVRFTRDTSGGTTEAEGYSISPYIPVENGDYLWLWNGILYDDTQSPYTTIVLYDSNKNHLGEYHTVHYERAITLAHEGVAYIRFVAKTADKEKTFVLKYTTSTAGDPTGVFLFKGNSIDSENYGKLCGFTIIDSNGALSRKAEPSSAAGWRNKINHPVVSAMFDLSKYSSIDIKHGWGSSSQQIIWFYDSNGDTASGKYYTAYTTDDTREGMSITQLGVYTNARIQICGFSIHDCYIVGHWTDENEVEREEYVWKGCDVVTGEKENVE